MLLKCPLHLYDLLLQPTFGSPRWYAHLYTLPICWWEGNIVIFTFSRWWYLQHFQPYFETQTRPQMLMFPSFSRQIAGSVFSKFLETYVIHVSPKINWKRSTISKTCKMISRTHLFVYTVNFTVKTKIMLTDVRHRCGVRSAEILYNWPQTNKRSDSGVENVTCHDIWTDMTLYNWPQWREQTENDEMRYHIGLHMNGRVEKLCK